MSIYYFVSRDKIAFGLVHQLQLFTLFLGWLKYFFLEDDRPISLFFVREEETKRKMNVTTHTSCASFARIHPLTFSLGKLTWLAGRASSSHKLVSAKSRSLKNAAKEEFWGKNGMLKFRDFFPSSRLDLRWAEKGKEEEKEERILVRSFLAKMDLEQLASP